MRKRLFLCITTLLFTATTLVQSAVLFKTVPYDPKGMTPIGLAAIGKKAEAKTELQLALRNPWFSVSQHADLVAMADTLGVRS